MQVTLTNQTVEIETDGEYCTRKCGQLAFKPVPKSYTERHYKCMLFMKPIRNFKRCPQCLQAEQKEKEK
jgi:hypothetical protein